MQDLSELVNCTAGLRRNRGAAPNETMYRDGNDEHGATDGEMCGSGL